jgi:hypothetical protein
VATVILAVPATTQAAPKNIFGMVGSHRADDIDYNQMRDANVTMYRFLVPWTSVQQDVHGEFHWGSYDQVVGKLVQRGIQPLPIAWGAKRNVTDSKKHKSQWRGFLKALVNRYGHGGEFWKSSGSAPSLFHRVCHCQVDPAPVKYFQLWNEPNLRKYLPSHMRSPKKYGKLLKISDKAIRSADRKAKTVLAGLAGYATIRHKPSPGSMTPWKFMKKLYKVKGVKKAFDAAAIDPYGPKIKIVKRLIDKTRKQMKKHGDRKTPMWITEIGWGSAKPSGKSSLNKGEKGQKRMLKKSFKLMLEERHSWKIKRILWYTWRDPRTKQNVCSFCDTAGLLENDRTHKPAFNAYLKFTGGFAR